MRALGFDRLSATDVSFLAAEDGRAGSHAHIGALTIFDGPAPTGDELAAHLAARLHRVPRYRQRLCYPPALLGRPLWVDAADFRLDYHLRRTALASPGGELELRALVGRVFSQRLDRSKPLWELWVVEGLAEDRWALLNKTHHAMVDGVGGADVLSVLLDDERAPATDGVPDWMPRPAPDGLDLTLRAVRDAVTAGGALALGAARIALRPWVATHALAGIGEVLWPAVDAATPAPFNAPVGPHRRVAFARLSLADVRTAKTVHGGTVNDVVLAVVAGALRGWLAGRGLRTDVRLRAGVPVSQRPPGDGSADGNHITMLAVDLPVWVDDPAARLAAVVAATRAAKGSRQALGAATLLALQSFAPPKLLDVAARASFSPRFVNLVVTNVPGPQQPMHLLGRRLRELRPVGFAGEGFGLTVAVMSYCGALHFGLIADRQLVADLDELAALLPQQLAALVTQCRKEAP